jgi:hypothetical protein
MELGRTQCAVVAAARRQQLSHANGCAQVTISFPSSTYRYVAIVGFGDTVVAETVAVVTVVVLYSAVAFAAFQLANVQRIS